MPIKFISSVVLALSVFVGINAAMAADLPVKAYTKAPPIVDPVYNWTGFYVGLNAGGGWNDTKDDVFPTGCLLDAACSLQPVTNNPLRSDSVRLNGSGFIGGAQAGYNWQRNKWVFGIEGDINYNGLNDGNSINRPLAAPLVGNLIHSETDKMDWFGTLRGRIGMTATPNLLLYGTGGLAFGQIRSASAVSFSLTRDTYAGSIDQTRVGWAIGAGGEWMIAPQWSIKAEYLYVDLGKASYTNSCSAAAPACPVLALPLTYQTDLRIHENIARFGVNYHFGGPIVAKY
jgi:outer membrane immunogenic protein